MRTTLLLLLTLALAAPAIGQADQHIDPNADFHAHNLTIVRHTATAFSLATARDGLVAASRDLLTCNSRVAADQDVATAVSVNTTGALGTFGTATDGLDVVTTAAEMQSVFNVATGYIKIITSIGHCGGPGAGIIGCAPTPGSSLAVVSGLSTAVTGETLMHEFGHNKGLPHRDAPGAPFMHTSTLGNNEVNAAEAAAYHMGGTRVGPNRPVEVGFVIDDTGSMSQEIAGVRNALTRHLATFPADACTAFQLNTFKDNVSARDATTDLTTIRGQVAGLTASGGGDCPEASIEALDAMRPRVRPNTGRVLFATDADPHPGQNVLGTIIAYLLDGIRVDVLLTGSCTEEVRAPVDGQASEWFAPEKPASPGIPASRVFFGSADPIPLGDDTFAQVMLPFAFPFAGESHSSVFVGSNGFLTFGSGDASRFPSGAALVAGAPRLAAVWTDLNPGAGGEVTGDLVDGNFEITFDAVPIFSDNSVVSTFTFVLRPDGTSAIRYGEVGAASFLAGAAAGIGTDPGEADLSVGGVLDPDDTDGAVYQTFASDFDLVDATVEFGSVESAPPRVFGSIAAFSRLARQTGGVFAFAPDVNSGSPTAATRFENAAFNIVQGGLTQAISIAEPSLGPQGGTVGVTITASGTNFQAGTELTVSGPGVSVSGLTVLSPTRLRATLAIDPGAEVGFRDLVATTDLGGEIETATGVGAFEVTTAPAGPLVLGIQPADGVQGQSMTVRIDGINTSFSAASVPDLEDGITVTDVRALSPTALEVDIDIAGDARVGLRDISVTTDAEFAGESQVGPFFVGESDSDSAPVLVSVSPTSVGLGTSHTLVVTAENTSFADGVSVLSFSRSGIDVLSTTVLSETSLQAEIEVDAAAELGARDVRVATGAEVVALIDALFVTGLAPAAPALVAPAEGALRLENPVAFSWTAVGEADAYDLQIAMDAAFTNRIVDRSETGTSASVNLDPSQDLFWRVRATNAFGASPFTAIRSFSTVPAVATEATPTRPELYPPVPNPSRSAATVRYDVADAGPVRIVLVNVLGQEVATLHDGSRAPGRYEASVDVDALSTGVYFVRATIGDFQRTLRLTVVR